MNPQYRFRMHRTSKDLSGYYYVDWNRAVPLVVIASNEKEAYEKARELSGTPKSGWGWIFSLDSVTEVEGMVE